jgi:TPR repeat protein
MRLATLVVAGLLVGGSPAFAQIPADLLARAEQGDALAQSNLGFMYATGDGVPEDDAEAVRWYRLAAAQGHAPAQSNLGRMYATGDGVPENTERAYMWFSVAAAGQSGEGRDRAVAARDRASARLTPEQRSRAQALATTCFNSTFIDCGEPE